MECRIGFLSAFWHNPTHFKLAFKCPTPETAAEHSPKEADSLSSVD